MILIVADSFKGIAMNVILFVNFIWP